MTKAVGRRGCILGRHYCKGQIREPPQSKKGRTRLDDIEVLVTGFILITAWYQAAGKKAPIAPHQMARSVL